MNEPTLNDAIRKRTVAEREAYIAGYAFGISACKDHGIDMAESFLKAMVGAESSIQEREAT